jgi:hypothetical protein
MSEQQQLKKREGRQRLLAVALVGLVAAMVGLAFASVPLYRLFCQATGYGGVPQRADRGADKVLDRTIRVRRAVKRELPSAYRRKLSAGRCDARPLARLPCANSQSLCHHLATVATSPPFADVMRPLSARFRNRAIGRRRFRNSGEHC